MAPAIKNKAIRSTLYTRDKKEKAQTKLRRRLALREAEQADPSLRAARLATNVPRTIESVRTWVGEGYKGAPGSETVDRRALPVQLVDDGQGGQRLDLAGLEDLFPDEEPLRMLPTDAETPEPAASTSAVPMEDDEKPGRGRVLLTTAPKPAEDVIALLDDLQNLLGGPKYAQIVPRKTTRFVLSKVTRWAAKRGYSAIMVVGEDVKKPATLTISKLPLGPTAHFRLTSVELNKDIQGHAAPTGHSPELVLSNMTTPLGLSIGRLLGTLFPPMPQLEGRQVVAVHNQRDFLFVRRFRYMFALRSQDEEAQRLAQERGMDGDVKTRMQEIGPRMTLKLRWLKRGTLAEGRRKANGAVTGEQTPRKATANDAKAGQDENEEAADPELASDGEDEAQIDQGVLDDDARDRAAGTAEALPTDDSAAAIGEAAPVNSTEVPGKKREKGPRRKTTFSRKTGDLMIPQLKPTPNDLPTGNLAKHRRKPKKGASILDSINLQGGVLDSRKEWAWDPRMQVSKKHHFM